MPQPVRDPTLNLIMAENARVLDDRAQLDDLLAFEGDDICIFLYSSAIDDDMNRKIVE